MRGGQKVAKKWTKSDDLMYARLDCELRGSRSRLEGYGGRGGYDSSSSAACLAGADSGLSISYVTQP